MEKVSQKMLGMCSSSIKILQFTGYLQVTMDHSQPFPWSHFRKFTTSAVLIVMYLVYLYLTHRVGTKWCSDSFALTVTEKFSHNTMLIAYTVLKIYFILSGSLFSQSAAKFWKINTEKLDEFCRLQDCFDFRCDDQGGTEAFEKIRRYVLKINAIGVFITVMTASFMMGRCLYNMVDSHGLDGLDSVDIIMPIICFFWCLQTHSHFSSAVYKSFFLKVYAACTQMIKQELAQLSSHTPSVANMADTPDAPIRLSVEIRAQRVRECIKGYGIITDLVREFSRHYGPEIAVELSVTVVVVLLSVFFSVAWGYTRMYLTGSIILVPASLFVIQLYVLSTEATNLHEEANRILHQLTPLAANDLPQSLQAQIQLFAINISANPPLVHACHFSRVEKHLLTSIASALITYLVVLVQFRKEDK